MIADVDEFLYWSRLLPTLILNSNRDVTRW